MITKESKIRELKTRNKLLGGLLDGYKGNHIKQNKQNQIIEEIKLNEKIINYLEIDYSLMCETILSLHYHNTWRRGEYIERMTVIEVGEAIDNAINILRKL